MIKVLIVEDSSVTRALLAHLLGQDPEIEIVGRAVDGEHAVTMAGVVKPDVILMDLHLPKLNGIEATHRLMRTKPVPVVIVTATGDPGDEELCFAALEAGALSLLPKPPSIDHPDCALLARKMIDTLKTMSQVKLVRRWTPSAASSGPVFVPAVTERQVRLIAIAASTGGPGVIAEILGAEELGAPVLVVQHIAAGFAAGFASWIKARTGRPAKLAEDRELAQPGTIYVAPDETHMGIAADGRIVLSTDAIENGFRPSASHLFRSVARSFGANAMGILLTGMGKDGATGLLELHEAGGVTVAQNEDTCVVFGMPGEAVRLGACDHVLAPEMIKALLSRTFSLKRKNTAEKVST